MREASKALKGIVDIGVSKFANLDMEGIVHELHPFISRLFLTDDVLVWVKNGALKATSTPWMMQLLGHYF